MSNFSGTSLIKDKIRDDSIKTQLKFDFWLIEPEYQQKLKRIAERYTRGTSLSWEDALQTAYVKVLQAVKANKFRYGGMKEFYRWATTVARFEIIDLVRKEKQRYWQSLNQPILGTDLVLMDTIADDFNLLETLERTDLVLKVLEVLEKLDQQYPDRLYLALWQGRVQGKNQTQISTELGVSQGAISKRWKELIHRLAEALDLLQDVRTENVQSQLRKRSEDQW